MSGKPDKTGPKPDIYRTFTGPISGRTNPLVLFILRTKHTTEVFLVSEVILANISLSLTWLAGHTN